MKEKMSLVTGGGFTDVQIGTTIGDGGWGGGGGQLQNSKSDAQHPKMIDVPTHCRSKPTDPWRTDKTWVAWSPTVSDRGGWTDDL